MQPWWTGLADASPDDASALHALGLGFMAARTLNVALEFNLFTHLAAGATSLTQIAIELGLAERVTQRLLNACTAIGLLRLVGEGYQNVPVVDKYLVRDRPTYIGSYVQLFDDLGYHRWGNMSQALRQNGPPEELAHPYRYLDDDADDTRDFIAAQHDGSTSLGYALARRFDFSRYQCLLDLGGGAGSYTVEILRHYPHLRAVLFDFPHVCEIAQSTLQAAGLTDRVETVAGDYEHDPLVARLAAATQPDVVLWSGNLHASSPDRCRQILRQLREILPDHGTILIHDYLLDAQGTGPLIPALLALHLTLVSEQGQVYRGAELRDLCTQAGFTDVDITDFLPGHSGLVIARAMPNSNEN